MAKNKSKKEKISKKEKQLRKEFENKTGKKSVWQGELTKNYKGWRKKKLNKKDKKEETKQLTTLKRYNLAQPQQFIEMALTLKDVIVQKNLFVVIKNKKGKSKKYVLVEGWQIAGGLLGYKQDIEYIKDLAPDSDKLYKWLAKAVVTKYEDNEKVAQGYAICSNKEPFRKSSPEYVVLSMAQTRAIGKAYRGLLGWIVKLAGYEPTPAEELMKEQYQEPKEKKEKEKKKQKKADLETIKKLINKNKSIDDLLEYKEKIEKSKRYNKNQKQALNKVISNRVDELQNKKQ